MNSSPCSGDVTQPPPCPTQAQHKHQCRLSETIYTDSRLIQNHTENIRPFIPGFASKDIPQFQFEFIEIVKLWKFIIRDL